MATRIPSDASLDAEQAYGAAVGKIPLISKEEELALATAYAAGDAAAGNTLVQSHLRFVISFARRYRNSGMPMSDLIQEGNVGLMLALGKYKTEYRTKKGKGVRFLSYARYWIHAMMLLAVREKHAVNPGRNRFARKVGKFRAVDADCQAKYGEPATDVQLMAGLGMSAADVVKLREAIDVRVTSFDAPLGDEDGDTRLEMFASPNASPEELVERMQYAVRVRNALSAIRGKVNASKMEDDVINERLLGEEPKLTHAAIGQKHGRSRARVQQLEASMTARLKTELGAPS